MDKAAGADDDTIDRGEHDGPRAAQDGRARRTGYDDRKNPVRHVDIGEIAGSRMNRGRRGTNHREKISGSEEQEDQPAGLRVDRVRRQNGRRAADQQAAAQHRAHQPGNDASRRNATRSSATKAACCAF